VEAAEELGPVSVPEGVARAASPVAVAQALADLARAPAGVDRARQVSLAACGKAVEAAPVPAAVWEPVAPLVGRGRAAGAPDRAPEVAAARVRAPEVAAAVLELVAAVVLVWAGQAAGSVLVAEPG
jgi:hypothetical protein